MKGFLHLLLSGMLSIFVLIGCSSNTDSVESSGTLNIYLTDAPADYESVTITFSEISAHIDGQWISIRNEEPITVDLLQWNNGKSIIIGTAEIPEGHYTQIRLKIEEASVTIDGITHSLFVPSGAQSGLKLLINFEIVAGSTYELVLDFDAYRSIVVTGPPHGPNKYILKPTLRVIPRAMTGSISGTIANPEHRPVAYAITTANDTITTSFVEQDGYFMLAYLPEGFYRVAIEDTLKRQFAKDSVQVVAGKNVGLGRITLE
ncbi:MAG: DUF4382 domain-containing protein [Calditrichaeota bacterium]|nr:DUF4382 domain-containing protein [Calditrichota bacterium]